VQQLAANVQRFVGQVDQKDTHNALVEGEPGRQARLHSMDKSLTSVGGHFVQVWMYFMPRHATGRTQGRTGIQCAHVVTGPAICH